MKDAANDAAVSSMNIPDAVMADSLNDTHDGEILGGIARPADLEGPGATQLGEVPEHQSALETHTHLASESESEHVSQEQAHLSPIKTKPSPPPDSSIVRLIEQADHSAGKLVNLLAQHFPCFRDETRFDGRKVHFLKRAQIFVADLWAAFNGTGYGAFDNIECLTMFAGKPCIPSFMPIPLLSKANTRSTISQTTACPKCSTPSAYYPTARPCSTVSATKRRSPRATAGKSSSGAAVSGPSS